MEFICRYAESDQERLPAPTVLHGGERLAYDAKLNVIGKNLCQLFTCPSLAFFSSTICPYFSRISVPQRRGVKRRRPEVVRLEIHADWGVTPPSFV